MSEIKQLITEINKNSKRSRLINNILWIVVSVLVIISFYTTLLAIESKNEVIVERDAKEAALIISDSLKNRAQELVEDLRIVEENLEGEKAELELVKVAYDSVRQVQLELLENQSDQLWEYTEKTNTIQAYTDYLKIKGDNGHAVIGKIKSLMRRTGYVQIQESNGTMNIIPSSNEYGLWEAKSARSIREGVIGIDSRSKRTGDVILQKQPFVILQDSIWSGKTRWAKIAY